jgi:hypothetical protein
MGVLRDLALLMKLATDRNDPIRHEKALPRRRTCGRVVGLLVIPATPSCPMITRRGFLLGSIGAGALLPARSMLAKAAQPETVINFEVPPGACDCHTHIFVPALFRAHLHA